MVEAGFMGRPAFTAMRGEGASTSCTITPTLASGMRACRSAALTGSGSVEAGCASALGRARVKYRNSAAGACFMSGGSIKLVEDAQGAASQQIHLLFGDDVWQHEIHGIGHRAQQQLVLQSEF